MELALDVKNLSVCFRTTAGVVHAVRDVSFSARTGETLAIVGESGCGKSVLCRSILRLLPHTAQVKAQSIRAHGQEIANLPERQMQKLRGSAFSMVLQNALSALDPSMRVGAQLAEAVRRQEPELRGAALRARVAELLDMVAIPAERAAAYPHELSGGMRQRCVLAMAISGRPKLLFADEPTTALDVTVQAQILDLLARLQRELQMTTVFVTHDLGVVARLADRVAVMYAGKIVELGTAENVFYDARHPYTQALLRSLPALARGCGTLPAMPGMPPTLLDPPVGDAFACRNEQALAIDYEQQPPMFRISDTHAAATWLLDPRAPKHLGGQADG